MILFSSLAIAFFYEIKFLTQTAIKGKDLSAFVYIGLIVFGSVSCFLFDTGSLVNFNIVIILAALFIGVISNFSTSWKVNVIKKIPKKSSGIMFGMLTAFHVIIESFLLGYVDLYLIGSVIFICITVLILYEVDLKSSFNEVVFYCIFISLLRNFEFYLVQFYQANPFLWMIILSIPAIFMMNYSKIKDFDIDAKKLAFLWLVLPCAYHYMIIVVSPTLAALTVTIGYVASSILSSKFNKKIALASLTSLAAVFLVVIR